MKNAPADAVKEKGAGFVGKRRLDRCLSNGERIFLVDEGMRSRRLAEVDSDHCALRVLLPFLFSQLGPGRVSKAG